MIAVKTSWATVIEEVLESFDFRKALEIVRVTCPAALKINTQLSGNRAFVADDAEQIEHLKNEARLALERVCNNTDQVFGHHGIPFEVTLNYLDEMPEVRLSVWVPKSSAYVSDDLLKAKGLWSKIVKRSDDER